jgi:hypothetical protein
VINDIRNYWKYSKKRSKIKDSFDYESIKTEQVNNPKYIRIMFVMNEILFESFPQMVLQSAYLFDDMVKNSTFTSLKIQQTISIIFSLVSISINCMLFLREVATQKMKMDISNIFVVTRAISNIFLVISRTIPLSLLFAKSYLIIVIYGLVRLVVHTFYNFIFEIYDFKLADNKRDITKKFSLAFALSVIKSIAFFEEFELTKSYIFYHLLILIENISMFFLFCYLNNVDLFNNSLSLLAFSIIIWCFIFGIIIEIVHWKIVLNNRPNHPKKFNITDISEHVNLFSLMKKYADNHHP